VLGREDGAPEVRRDLLRPDDVAPRVDRTLARPKALDRALEENRRRRRLDEVERQDEREREHERDEERANEDAEKDATDEPAEPGHAGRLRIEAPLAKRPRRSTRFAPCSPSRRPSGLSPRPSAAARSVERPGRATLSSPLR